LENVVMTVWTSKASMEAARTLREIIDQTGRRYGAGSGVHVVLNRPELPDRETREEMARITQDFADSTVASAMVLVGDGFWASAMRGLATSLHAVTGSGQRFKMGIFGTTRDAAAWLAPLHSAGCSTPVSVFEVLAALDELCARAVQAS
jgi:hypothetical protein